MKVRPWLITLSICICISLLLVVFKTHRINSAIAFADSLPERSETVEVAVVTYVPYINTIEVLGEAKAPRSISISNEYPGRISKVNLVSGSRVEEGQLLVEFDTQTEAADLRALQARLALADSSYKRALSLSDSEALSEAVFEQTAADKLALEAQIESLKSIIQKKRVVAPFDGTVGIQDFEVGQFLDANTLITNLVGDHEFVWVDFSVVQFYPELELGSSVDILPIRSSSLKSPSTAVRAEIVAVDASLERSTRSRKYRAKAHLTSAGINTQEIVRVVVPVSDVSSVVALPSSSLRFDGGNNFVYVLENTETENQYRAMRKEVSVLHQEKNAVLLSADLAEGQKVAGAGAFKLYPGVLVNAGTRRTKDAEDVLDQHWLGSAAGAEQ